LRQVTAAPSTATQAKPAVSITVPAWLRPAAVVLHAAGPGHGKAVIAGYLMAGERALKRGFTLSLLAALLNRGLERPREAGLHGEQPGAEARGAVRARLAKADAERRARRLPSRGLQRLLLAALAVLAAAALLAALLGLLAPGFRAPPRPRPGRP
jgi:hypothetical protein